MINLLIRDNNLRFDVFTAVTMKNTLFWFLQEPHGVVISHKTAFFAVLSF
jgi:hypothetical protein